MKSDEHKLQAACVRYFRAYYPEYMRSLFAVPNEGRRTKVVAGRMKAQGMLSGVSDLVLLLPRYPSHALCIEFKLPGTYQTASQKEFEGAVMKNGYEYVVIRSFEEFCTIVHAYMNRPAFKIDKPNEP